MYARIVGWMVAGALLSSSAAGIAEPVPGECAPVELDAEVIAALASRASGSSDPAAVMNVVNPDAKAAIVINRAAGAQRVVSAWKRCPDEESPCTLHLGVVEPGADDALGLVHGHRLDPSRTPWAMPEGLELTHLTMLDLAGRPVAALLYEIVTEPAPAVGWTTHEVLVLMDVDSGALLFDAEVGRGGQASVHEVCEWSAQVVDPGCDGQLELVLEQRCGEAHCFDVDAAERAQDPESYEDCEPPTTEHTRTKL